MRDFSASRHHVSKKIKASTIVGFSQKSLNCSFMVCMVNRGVFLLRLWLNDQLDEKKVEPNSGLGKAISYMLNHREPLTLFLRVPNAPLDNNLCEQVLKKAVLNRKNSLFYKTEHGAYIGDLFMSLIYTCNLNDVNPFDYLTVLQRNSSLIFKYPQNWLPWNYKSMILSKTP